MNVELGRVHKGFHEGQALSQKFTVAVRNNCKSATCLGDTPLRVAGYTDGVEISVDNPLRNGYWLGPDTDFADLADQFISDRTDDYAVRVGFLSGELKIRAKVWQVSDTDVAFLTNKPIRRIVTVRLKNKGDSIKLENEYGYPYVLTR